MLDLNQKCIRLESIKTGCLLVLTIMMMENIKVEAGENDWSLFCFYK